MNNWFVWSIRLGKFDTVSKYIEEKVPEVKQVLYPTVTTERILKDGTAKKKKTPLYSGYIFLQYEHDPENPHVWLKLKSHPFVTNYVGPCTPADLISVDSLQKLELVNNDTIKSFSLGDSVRVNGGLCKGYSGIVTAVMNKTIRVEIEAPKKMRYVFSPDDLDIVGRPGLVG